MLQALTLVVTLTCCSTSHDLIEWSHPPVYTMLESLLSKMTLVTGPTCPFKVWQKVWNVNVCQKKLISHSFSKPASLTLALWFSVLSVFLLFLFLVSSTAIESSSLGSLTSQTFTVESAEAVANFFLLWSTATASTEPLCPLHWYKTRYDESTREYCGNTDKSD